MLLVPRMLGPHGDVVGRGRAGSQTHGETSGTGDDHHQTQHAPGELSCPNHASMLSAAFASMASQGVVQAMKIP